MTAPSKTLCLALPLLCALPALLRQGTPPAASQENGRTTFTSLREEQNAKAAKLIQGAWILERFDHVFNTIDSADIRGGALFTETYMMVIVHARTPSNSLVGDDYRMLFQSGMYQYQFDDNARLLCSTFMGDSNFSGKFEYEPPNTPREFDIEVGEYGLVLTRPDGSKLVFKRLRPDAAFPEEALKNLAAQKATHGNPLAK